MTRALADDSPVRVRRDRGDLAGRRLAAYVLDWLVGLVVGWLLALAAAGILLASSDLNRHDPPNSALYAAIFLLAAWFPVWLLYTAFAWSWHGVTPGMAVLRIGIVDGSGGRPGPLRAAWRALLLFLFSLPLLLSPILLAIAVALGSLGPLYIWLPALVLTALSAVACFSAFTTAEGLAWHDRASGTRLVRSGQTPESIERH